MTQRVIYSKDTMGIQKLYLSFDDDKLKKIRDELITFYKIRSTKEEYVGTYPDYDETRSIIEIMNVSPVSISQEIGMPVYKFDYMKTILYRLARLVNNILLEKNRMNLSFLLNELYSYDCDNQKEEEYKNKIINCFNYEIAKRDYRTKSLDRHDKRYSKNNYLYTDDTEKIDLPKTYRLGIKPHDDY